MTTAQIDYNDPRYKQRAGEILDRHQRSEHEDNIRSAVRDFLAETGLARREEMVEEDPPAEGSRRAVDLTALDTFIECKRRIGTTGGFAPNPDYVDQIDGYLAQSERQGRMRTGILTDGKHWLLRWPGAGTVKTAPPYGFVLDSPERWLLLFEWLRDRVLLAGDGIEPTRDVVEQHFGPSAPSSQQDIARLKSLYTECANATTVSVKRQLWENLLTAALGEIAGTPAQLDDLFVRHTYLSAVIGVVIQSAFGIDIRRLAEHDPGDLLLGRDFRNKTGLQGIVESDFFVWPTEVGGETGKLWLRALARRIARFDWAKAPSDVAAILYQTVIPPEERRQLGEYYTPAWLAETIVSELVTEPLAQRVLDPACGSGAFIAEAVTHFIEAADEAELEPGETLEGLRGAVAGIDVHPAAVHLARAAWVLAAQPAIQAAADTEAVHNITVPVYLGDALQLRFRTGDLFSQHEVTVQVEDEKNTELVFPVDLVEQAETFDAFMGDIADAIEAGDDPMPALDDHGIVNRDQRRTLTETIGAMRRLHAEGRNHIWAYYTRNLVRPVALSRSKVDVIVGNPPWINYNQTVSTLRTELKRLSKDEYGIWAGGQYATHQDVSALFCARAVDLYADRHAVIGMVMPHSALQAGQFTKWRTGLWKRRRGRTLTVNFHYRTAWDLEALEPNDFFPVPACVVFAQYTGESGQGASALAVDIKRWVGRTGTADVSVVDARISDDSSGAMSPYHGISREGATFVPRRLFFVEETENPAIIAPGGTVTTNPRRSVYDKKPWKCLDLTALGEQTVENAHVFDVHLGETLVPYATLDPLKAILPIRHGENEIPIEPDGVGGISVAALERRMRGRWKTVSDLWDTNKGSNNNKSLSEQLDYYGKLSAQLEWMRDPGDRPIRVVYAGSGAPTAALLETREALVDYTLYRVPCRNTEEAYYLLAIINSDTLRRAVTPLMPKGQYGARHLQKHLWKLAIPDYDSADPSHIAVSEAGRTAAAEAPTRLTQLRQERERITGTIARREIRKWLRESAEGEAVESAVSELLEQAGGGFPEM